MGGTHALTYHHCCWRTSDHTGYSRTNIHVLLVWALLYHMTEGVQRVVPIDTSWLLLWWLWLWLRLWLWLWLWLLLLLLLQVPLNYHSEAWVHLALAWSSCMDHHARLTPSYTLPHAHARVLHHWWKRLSELCMTPIGR